jgi:apolipoprotein N-acyltransferase
VPFGEYVPLKPLIGWIVGPFIPFEDGLTPGTSRTVFTIDGWRFATVICFEDMFPRLTASFERGDTKLDFIVNITNEGWFKDGAELDHHLAIAVFRAVECRAGFARAANTGISAFISPTGRVLSALTVDGRDREVAGVLRGRATSTDTRSPYLVVGELFAWLCVAACSLCMLAAALPGIVRRGSSHGPSDSR